MVEAEREEEGGKGREEEGGEQGANCTQWDKKQARHAVTDIGISPQQRHFLFLGTRLPVLLSFRIFMHGWMD